MGKGCVAILGGRGMLGTDLAAELGRRGIGYAVWDLPELNVCDAAAVKRAVESSDMVVNCAAFTNVDGAESQQQLAQAINGDAAGQLGRIAGEAGKFVLHISTDFVFDGDLNRPYRETDKPNPISVYGRTKLAGEELLAKSGCRHCILRVEWTYGRAGQNFVSKILSRASQGGPLKVVDDQWGSPTATTEAAKTICALLEKQAEGIYHFAAAGYASRFETAKFILAQRGMKVDVLPCKTSEFVTPARRPLNSRLDCSKISGLPGEPIAEWQGPLGRFVESL